MMQKELLVCVLNAPEMIDDILAGLLEAGVSGCTIIDSKGMGKIISENMSIFAGFKNVFAGARSHNITLFSVLDKSLTQEAVRIIEETHHGLTDESIGIIFTLPITLFKSLR